MKSLSEYEKSINEKSNIYVIKDSDVADISVSKDKDGTIVLTQSGKKIYMSTEAIAQLVGMIK